MVVKHHYLVMCLFTVGFIVYLLSASPAILTFKGAVAHGKRLSQMIQQLLNNKSLEYIFYTNM